MEHCVARHGFAHWIDLTREMRSPHSLGLLYSAFTYYWGFKVNSGEHELMGLAPYGRPVYRDLIRRDLVDIKPDGKCAVGHGILQLLSAT